MTQSQSNVEDEAGFNGDVSLDESSFSTGEGHYNNDEYSRQEQTFDVRSSETNSQYAYDQGRPDLLMRLRSMQGGYNEDDNGTPQPQIIDSPEYPVEVYQRQQQQKVATRPKQ